MTAVLEPVFTLPPPPDEPQEADGDDEGMERITFLSIPRATEARLKTAELTGDSQTDVVNRALQVYAYLVRAWNEGGQVLIWEGGNTAVELTLG